MLPREDFGRRHQRGLLAGFGDGGGGEQRHHGFAGADVALQQPQHPHRLLQVMCDGGGGIALRRRQRVGQGIDHLASQVAVAGMARAGGPAQLRAHQCQRQLSREQFVEGEPRPERAIRQNVRQFDRDMDTLQRFSQRRKIAAAQHFRADPFRQRRKPLDRQRHRAPQRPQRQSLGERIDRLDAGKFRQTFLIDDAVGVDHLQGAVEHLYRAGDVTLLADRQELFDVVALATEIGQQHVAGVVAGIDQMRRARAARRRGTMPVDGDFQRRHGPRHGIADFRPRPAVDDIARQMQQQVDQPRRLAAAEQVAQQLVLSRADAGQAGDRRK